MTGLGAALYGGFFGLAALWLFLTAERGEGVQAAEVLRLRSARHQ